jgi:hypothetical protein
MPVADRRRSCYFFARPYLAGLVSVKPAACESGTTPAKPFNSRIFFIGFSF